MYALDAKKQRMDKQIKSRQTLEQINRETGLKKSLTLENRGFAMLQRMGYVEGQTLGRTNGLIVPIEITIKTDRAGLGRDAALKELYETQAKIREKKLSVGTANEALKEYRQRWTQKAQLRSISIDLVRCQKTCELIERTREGISQPHLPWFWIAEPSESEKPEINNEEIENAIETNDKTYDDDDEGKNEVEYEVFTFFFYQWYFC